MGTMFSRIYTSKIASLSGVYHSERLSNIWEVKEE